MGELACLSAALLWAVSVTLFRPAIERHGARTVNLTKCLLGAILQIATVLALGQHTALLDASWAALSLLAVSGIIGLTLGDTALFGAVARIGVSRTLLLQTLAPLFAALFAAGWRGEVPSAQQSAGAGLILLGVAVVVAPARTPSAGRSAARDLVPGIGLAISAALGQGAGVVLAQAGMTDVPPLPASAFRLGIAAIGLLLLGLVTGRLQRLPALVRSPWAMGRVVPATTLGTYVALFLMMTGIALAPAAVAVVLLATTPIFALVIDRVVLGRLVPARGWAGALLALAGVAVLGAA